MADPLALRHHFRIQTTASLVLVHVLAVQAQILFHHIRSLGTHAAGLMFLAYIHVAPRVWWGHAACVVRRSCIDRCALRVGTRYWHL